MPIGSPNKTITATLIETLQFKVEPNKLYDALKKIASDLNKTYEALFEGPLPAVSGQNLNLVDIPRVNLPDKIAYTDESNIFTENQNIASLLASLIVQNQSVPGATLGVKGIVQAVSDSLILISGDLRWDGADYVSDSGNGIGILIDTTISKLSILQMVGGVIESVFEINEDRIVTIGVVEDLTNALPNDLVLKSENDIRSLNFAGDKCLSLIRLDINDLIGVGSDAENTGKGHFAIPQVTSANLPAAGASSNGIIVIDKTNNRFCFYHSGNRYYVNGTSF